MSFTFPREDCLYMPYKLSQLQKERLRARTMLGIPIKWGVTDLNLSAKGRESWLTSALIPVRNYLYFMFSLTCWNALTALIRSHLSLNMDGDRLSIFMHPLRWPVLKCCWVCPKADQYIVGVLSWGKCD